MLKMYLIIYTGEKSENTVIPKRQDLKTKTTNKSALDSMLNAKKNSNINSKSI